MIQVVIDTSVLIRYLIRPSVAIRRLIEDVWLEDKVRLVTAPALLDELRGVLARESIQRFIAPEEGAALMDTIIAKAYVLPPLGAIPAFTRDPKDDQFVACALAGEAPYLVTVDMDLLVLGAVSEVQIVTPEAFLDALSASAPAPED